MLLNNLVETFNACIKDSRDKPLMTMLEEIRAAIHKVCPKIQKKVERSKDEARNCICRWQNELEFEVDHMFDARRIVNLVEGTCSCGRW
jgi:hypothetical protein